MTVHTNKSSELYSETEHKQLLRRWATGKASARDIERCQRLDRMAEMQRELRSDDQSGVSP